eukprot:4111434-Amphidinium_carterae.1
MLSGRHTFVVCDSRMAIHYDAAGILECCCDYLGIDRIGTEVLVYGTDILPAEPGIHNWPGIQAPGRISEYELVV